jgi:hypothetical protein
VTIVLSCVDLGSDNLFEYNGHKKIPKRLAEPKSKQENTMVTRRYQRDYQNLNLHKTIQWSQEDIKECLCVDLGSDNLFGIFL